MPFDVRKSSAFPTERPTVPRLRRRSGADNYWPMRLSDGGIAACKIERAAGEAQLRRTSRGKARKASFDTDSKAAWLITAKRGKPPERG